MSMFMTEKWSGWSEIVGTSDEALAVTGFSSTEY